MNEQAVTRRYKFIEEIECPLEFVSAANGVNVVSIFEQALKNALNYKQNPHEDDFMNDVLDLLKDDKKFGIGEERKDDFFWAGPLDYISPLLLVVAHSFA